MNNKICVSTWFLEATLSCKTTAFNYIRDWVEGTVPLLKSLFHNIICPRLHHDLQYQRELNQQRLDKLLLASHLTNLQPSIDPWKYSKFQGAELRQLRSLSLSYIHRQWHSKTKTQKPGCHTSSFNLQARHSPNLLYTYHQVTLLSLPIGPR